MSMRTAHSVLEKSVLQSPLAGLSKLNPKGGLVKKTILASLLLTSLVDAFSILVMYLVSSQSASGELPYMSKTMVLPKAAYSMPMDRHTIVRVEAGQIMVEDKVITTDKLTEALLGFRKKIMAEAKTEIEPALIIQADKKQQYNKLSEVIQAGAQAGFSEIKFAVLAER